MIASSAARSRSGFTLIELLVVIAIIAILVAILLPAVQQAREAARRSQCKNNMKQLGLALHNYHDAYEQYPMGAMCAIPGTANWNSCGTNMRHNNWGTTWAIALLPYIDQQNVWDQWDSDRPSNVQPLVTGAPISVFKCPSDFNNAANMRGTTSGATLQDGSEYSKGNYAANYGGGNGIENISENGVDGVLGNNRGFKYPGSPNLGAFHQRDRRNNRYGLKLRDAADGPSTSIALAEIRTTPDTNGGDCRGAWGRAGCAYVSAYGWGRPADGPTRIATPNSKTRSEGGLRDYEDQPPYCNNGLQGQLQCGDKSTEGARSGIVARSVHPGGVNATFNDGRVVFVGNQIDREAYRGMLTVRGDDPYEGTF